MSEAPPVSPRDLPILVRSIAAAAREAGVSRLTARLGALVLEMDLPRIERAEAPDMGTAPKPLSRPTGDDERAIKASARARYNDAMEAAHVTGVFPDPEDFGLSQSEVA